MGTEVTHIPASTMDDALTTMLADLGNHRLEELAQDDPRRPYIPVSNCIVHAPLRIQRNNSISVRWKAAIQENLFDDDDAAGVKELDTLDDGQAHRKRKIPDAPRQPKYDPSRPTYGKPNPTHGRPYIISNGAHQVSSLGGIVPDGGQVKLWHSGRVISQSSNVDNLTPAPPTPIQGNSSVGNTETANNRLQHVVLAVNPPMTVTGQPNGQQGRFQPLAASESSVNAPHALAQPNDAAPEAQGSGTTNDPRILFKEGLLVLEESGARSRVPGRIVIYGIDVPPVCICELTINDEKVIRADIRSLLRLFVDGSRVMFRWNGPNGEGPLVIALYFENILKATSFQREAERLKAQYQDLSVDIGIETSIKLLTIQDNATQEGRAKAAEAAPQQLEPRIIETSNAGTQITVTKPANTKGEQLEQRIVKPSGATAQMAIAQAAKMAEQQPAPPIVESSVAVAQKATGIAADTEIQQLEQPIIELSEAMAKMVIANHDKTVKQRLEPPKNKSSATVAEKETAEPINTVEKQFEWPAIEPLEAIAQKTTVESLDSDTVGQQLELLIKGPPQIKNGNQEKPVESTAEIGQRKAQPFIPPHLRVPEALEVPKVTNAKPESNGVLVEDLIDLASLPSSRQASEPPKGDEAHVNGERSIPSNGVANEQETTNMKKAGEPMTALGDLLIIEDICAGKSLSKESRRFLSGITSADYSQVIQTSDSLAMAAKDPSFSPQTYVASIFHLMQRKEFLDLSWDQKRKTIEVIYANACHGNSRNVRTAEEILALQSVEGGATHGTFLYLPQGTDLQPKKTPLTTCIPPGRTPLTATSPEFRMPLATLSPQSRAPLTKTSSRSQTPLTATSPAFRMPSEPAKAPASLGLMGSHWAHD